MNIRWFCNQLLQGLMLPSSADLSQMYPENVMKLITIKSEEQKMRCIAKKHLISIQFYHFLQGDNTCVERKQTSKASLSKKIKMRQKNVIYVL